MTNSGVGEAASIPAPSPSSTRSPIFLVSGVLLLLIAALTLGAVIQRSAVLVGAFTIAAGALQIVHGAARRRGSLETVHVASGFVYVTIGAVAVTHTAENRLALALLAALFLAAQGIIRLVSMTQVGRSALTLAHTITALALAFITVLWALQHLVVSVILEVLTWRAWPPPSLRGIGLFIVIDMLFCAASLLLPRRATRES